MSDNSEKKKTTQEELLTEVIKMHTAIEELKEKLASIEISCEKAEEMYKRHERLYNA